MQRAVIPYIFLAVLFVILVFVAGVKLGGSVEQTNKQTAAILSLTPPPPSPTLSPIPLQFTSYNSKSCGVQFLYPNTIKATKESTGSAIFVDKNNVTKLQFSCDPTTDLTKEFGQSPKLSTEAATFQNAKISMHRGMLNTGIEIITFQLRNPQNGKNIGILVEKTLYPLLERSLQYNR